MREEREIKGADLEEILNLKSEDICATLIIKYFAKPAPDEDPRFLTNDYFVLPKERFGLSKSGYTTIGIYICNLHLIVPSFLKVIGYVNAPFNKKQVGKIESAISTALYNKEITADQFADYINRIQWLGGNKVMTLITPSITSNMLSPAPGLEEYKDKLFEENKEAIEDGNAIVGSEIESKLIDYATDFLKKDEGYENFASGAKMNIPNNYKTMYIMKGPLLSGYDGKYHINKSDYSTGVSKEDYTSVADSTVFGASSRAIGTQEGGYLAKKSNQTMNDVCAGPKDSDCGTKEYLKAFIYPGFEHIYMDRYIIEDNKLVKLTSDNIKNYVGKEVKLRSPMYCHMKGAYCNKCVGDQPYKLGLLSYGLAMNRLQNTLLNAKLKAVHDVSIKTNEININNIFKFK